MQSGGDTNDHGFVVMVLHMLMHNIDESEWVGGIKKKGWEWTWYGSAELNVAGEFMDERMKTERRVDLK